MEIVRDGQHKFPNVARNKSTNLFTIIKIVIEKLLR